MQFQVLFGHVKSELFFWFEYYIALNFQRKSSLGMGLASKYEKFRCTIARQAPPACLIDCLILHADDHSGLGRGPRRSPDEGATVAAVGLPGDRAQAPHRHRLQLQTGMYKEI